MSVKHTAWVWEHSRAEGGALLVALALADSVNHVGGNDHCWPHQARLAEMVRLSERQVTRAVARLVELGEIEIERTQTGNRYRLLMPQVTNCPNDTGVVSDTTPTSGSDTTPTSGPYVEPEVEPERNQKTTPSPLIQEVWEHYVATLDARRQKLDSTRRTIIKNALKVRSVAECKLAIEGLRVSPFHNGDNDRGTKYLGVQYALKGRGAESTDERIDKMAALAPAAPGVPGIDEAKVQRWLDNVRYTVQTGSEVERGKEAVTKLRAAGFQVEKLSEAPWARLVR